MIYFVRNDQTGLIKIGVTINLQTRLIQLRSTYRDLELLGIMNGSYEEKTQLHDQFAHQRIRRTDWFRACDDLQQYITTHTHMQLPGENSPIPPIDKPISLSSEVRAMLNAYVADLEDDQNQGNISYNEALHHLFKTHLPHYARQTSTGDAG